MLLAALASMACGEHGVHQNAAQGAVHDISEFEAIANRFIDNGYAKGIVFALVRGDSVKIRGYGQANEDGAAPDAHTLFEIGSIAKIFTGITLAAMVADGEVALEEPLADFVPRSVRVPEHGGKPITLLRLATHSSGLPRFRTFKTDWDMAWYYEYLSDYELTRDPGAQYEYSNLGFLLLGDALSLRSKKPCDELVKERVLVPIGMKHTIVGAIPADEHHADGYERSGVAAPPLDGECVMSSDATDMAAFVQANLDPPRALREAIHMAQAEHGSRPDGRIGLAWNIGLGEEPGVRWHTGGTMGFRSYLALDGEKEVGVVVLANTSTEAVTALGYALFQRLRGEPRDLALPRLVSLSPETLERYTGRFELEPDFYLTITLERGVLFAQFTEGLKHSIYPSSETTFHYIVDEVRLEFEMGANGRASRVVVHATDETAPADRVN